jgi:hypothetical protein
MAQNPNKAVSRDQSDFLADLKYRQKLAQRRAGNPSGSTLPEVQYDNTAGGRYRQKSADRRQSGAGNQPVPPENNAVDRTRMAIRSRRQQMG